MRDGEDNVCVSEVPCVGIRTKGQQHVLSLEILSCGLPVQQVFMTNFFLIINVIMKHLQGLLNLKSSRSLLIWWLCR
jgi:hypothetical protein